MTAFTFQSGEDLGHSLLLETLGRQLQEAKDRLKQQVPRDVPHSLSPCLVGDRAVVVGGCGSKTDSF